MNIIAAADTENAIGYKNRLLFSIPEDMEFFKKTTTGKTVVMGRKTFESLRVKPLPGRRNIVLTENRNFFYENTETAHSVSELNELLKNTDSDEIFVIGGEQIYRLLLDYCNTAYITRIYSSFEADSYIADFDSLSEWNITEKSVLKEYKGIKYQFIRYERV